VNLKISIASHEFSIVSFRFHTVQMPDYSDRQTLLRQVHAYTQCKHRSPPRTRPLNAQPVPDASRGASKIEGRCCPCDKKYRRRVEASIVYDYLDRIRVAQDSNAGDAEVETLVNERDRVVDKVWKGYASRWGIGVVGKEDGRVELAWERPDLSARAKTKRTEVQRYKVRAGAWGMGSRTVYFDSNPDGIEQSGHPKC